MAEKKTEHRAAAAAGPDPDGEAWTAEASKRWNEAVAESERLNAEHAAEPPASAKARKEQAKERVEAIELFDPVPLPDFQAGASDELEGEILGRFVFHPTTNLVHDVTRASSECRIQETPRIFVHFASELESAIPADAEPHSCMS